MTEGLIHGGLHIVNPAPWRAAAVLPKIVNPWNARRPISVYRKNGECVPCHTNRRDPCEPRHFVLLY